LPSGYRNLRRLKTASGNEIEVLRRQRTRLHTLNKVIDELKVQDIEELNIGFSSFIASADSGSIVTRLTKCFNLDFNVFQLKKDSDDQDFVSMMYYVFYHLDYFNVFNIRTTKYINFAKYHNATHCADVMQLLFKII
jgi:hypothetical protein